MTSLFRENIIDESSTLEDDDKIIQLFITERYDWYAVFQSGRIFKKRARGQSGSYDNWIEVDIAGEIRTDLKI